MDLNRPTEPTPAADPGNPTPPHWTEVEADMNGRLTALGGIIEAVREKRLATLERRLATGSEPHAELQRSSAEAIKFDGLLTRAQVAAYLKISTRQVQRMEAAERLLRCPGLGATVRYAARDVLRLASAR